MGLNVGGSDEPVGLEEGVSVGEEGGLVSSPLEGAEEGANETVGLSVGVVEGADEIVGNAVDVVGNEVGLGEGSIAGGANGQYSCLASPSSLCQEERGQHALMSVRSTYFKCSPKPPFTYEDGPASTLAIDKCREKTTIV